MCPTHVNTHSYGDVYISSLSFVPKCTVEGLSRFEGRGILIRCLFVLNLGNVLEPRSLQILPLPQRKSEKEKKKMTAATSHPQSTVLISLEGIVIPETAASIQAGSSPDHSQPCFLKQNP